MFCFSRLLSYYLLIISIIAAKIIVDELPKSYFDNTAIRFILMTRQHSGSHFLKEIISMHPNVLMHDEVCMEKHLRSTSSLYKFDCLDILKFSLRLSITSKDLVQYLSNDSKFLNEISVNTKAIGCILHQNQGWENAHMVNNLNKQIIHSYKSTTDKEIRLVFLHRKNYLSISLASSNTLYANNHTKEDHKKHVVNLREVSDDAIKTEDLYKLALQSFPNNIIVSYERLTTYPSSIFIKIFRYLDIMDLKIINLDKIIGPNKIVIQINTSDRHHEQLPYTYIKNLNEVTPILKSKKYINDDDLSYCMLYNDCKWYSSYCTNQRKCFI